MGQNHAVGQANPLHRADGQGQTLDVKPSDNQHSLLVFSMRDPLRRLKTLPWQILLQNAALTVLIATMLDILLAILLTFWLSSSLGSGLVPLLNFAFIVLPFLAGMGIGALAVILLERLFPSIYLDTATLWAAVPCLALCLGLKGLIPQIPLVLASLSYPLFIGLVLGVFFKGKRYWRY